MSDDRARRLAENEAVFRGLNESIRSAAAGHGSDDHLYEFFCECSRQDCLEQVELALTEYEAVRRRGDRFFVTAGHDDPAIEQVVERNGRYDVVEKFGEGAAVARDLDPRA